MRDVTSYLSWLLPAFQEHEDWAALVTSIAEELSSLHRHQMGSSDSRGFSRVNLIPNGDFSDTEEWRTYALPYTDHGTNMLGGDWRINLKQGWAGILTGSNDTASILMRFLPNIFINQRYRLSYEVTESTLSEGELTVATTNGQENIPVTVGKHEVVIELSDYYLQFLATYSGVDAFKFTDISLIEEYDSTSEERFSLLRRVMDIDTAPRWVLERAQKSLGLPWFEDLPDALARRFLRYATDFGTLGGTTAGSALLFYLFGFRVRFEYLYAHNDDYEGKTYPWIPQESYLHLMSSDEVGGPVYGEVAYTTAGTHQLLLLEGHTVLVGDLITDDTNEFENYYRRVVAVNENELTLDAVVAATVGDLISIVRQPDYPVNPDPANYFPIPWIDIFLKTDLLSDFDLSFNDLRGFLEDRLPANVNIRNIGYDSDIPFHSFQFSQTLFRQRFGNVYDFEFDEISIPPSDGTTPAGDTDSLVVGLSTPETGFTEDGTPCDAYSYVVVGDIKNPTLIGTEVNDNE